MIYSMTVVNHLGDSLKIGLRNSDKSGFLITSITGLGPGEADISTTELAAADGGVYNSARITSRNIVIEMKYLLTDTVEEARLRSYKYFPLKKNVTLFFETEDRQVYIEGYVESNNPDIFSSSETTQISIVCPDPFFYAVGSQTSVFSGIEPMFEFSFCNDSLTQPMLIMGEMRNKYENLVVYEGDAETGMIITLHAVGPAKNISVYNLKTREVMRIDTDKVAAIVGSSIKLGDDIVICTVRGKKSVTFKREGKEWNILNALDRDSKWLQLEIGDNTLAFDAEEGYQNLQFTIQNDLLYEGI